MFPNTNLKWKYSNKTVKDEQTKQQQKIPTILNSGRILVRFCFKNYST